jgi:drug/metabolite transporter (DMT)-like permease
MEKYRKFIVAALGAAVAIAAIVWPGNTTVAQIIGIVAALATAAGVYQVPNEPMPGVRRY